MGAGISRLRVAPTAVDANNSEAADATARLAEAVRADTQDFEAMQRLEAGEGVHGSAECQPPMYTQIGHTLPRSERCTWKTSLRKPDKLTPQARDPVLDGKILRGDIGDVLAHLLRENRRIVCFLLSSTFTDTEWERNLLIADVVPYLQEYARQRGFEFRLSEMRWGIRSEASSAHQTSEICMAELERCQRESQGLSYVFLGCQKYGFRPFPPKIPQGVYENLHSCMSKAEKRLVNECFCLDENVAPADENQEKVAPADKNQNEWLNGTPDSGAGPVYVLRSAQDFEDWSDRFEKLQVAFRAAALKIWGDKAHLLRDPSSRAYIKKFFVSVTEEEFCRGLLWLSEKDQREKTLVFRRTLTLLATHAAEPGQVAEAKKFIDMQGTDVDKEAQEMLEQQLAMVPKDLNPISYDLIEWGPGINPTISEHAAYLCKFLDHLCTEVMVSINSGAQKLATTPDAVVEEVTQHLRFALIRVEKFTPTESTKEVERAAASYLNVTHTDGAASGGDGVKDDTALVIYGRSGAGKTYLLSKILAECLKSLSAGGAVVIRFLGTTPRSSNVHALLTSLCEQLRRLYAKDEAVPTDFKELRAYFHVALTEWPTAEHPLTLFIDSVDQLDDSYAGRQLDWLPVTGIRAHVKLVVSTLPDYPEFKCLSILQHKLGKGRAADSSRHCVEVKTISEPDKVLMHLLSLRGRKLTDEQEKHVMEAFEKRTDADAAGTPLWLTIVTQAVSSWSSYDGVPFVIKPSVRDLITAFFERLKQAHGTELVRAVLAYITIAKNGVSETELQHLLSLEDSVLSSIYVWWVPPVRIAPPLPSTRLLTDLDQYITRRGDGSGAGLVSWYHRQFWEAAGAWLFGTVEHGEAVKQQRHKELADYFEGTWAGKCKPYSAALNESVQRPQFFPGEAAGERNVPHQPLVLEGDLFDPKSEYKLNTRRIHELVHHLILSKQVDRAVRELTSAAYIAAKFALMDGAVLMRQYADAQRVFTAAYPTAAADLGKCKATVGRFLKDLERFPPLFALQMCVQEPDQHPLCIAAKRLLDSASDTQPAEHGVGELKFRVIEWTNKHHELDPCQLEIKVHTGSVSSVAYFPDSGDGNDAHIASASADGTLKIISTVSSEVVLELQGHTGAVTSVAVSKDGTRLASGGKDITVWVWNAQTGQEFWVLRGHIKDNPECKCRHDAGRLKCDYEANPNCPVIGHSGGVNTVTWSPDGKSLASASSDRTVRIWDAQTREVKRSLSVDSGVQSISYSPTGDMIAAGCWNGNIYVVDALKAVVKRSLSGHSDYVNAVAWSLDGLKLASASDDKSIKIWNPSTGTCESTVRGHIKDNLECKCIHNAGTYGCGYEANLDCPVSGHSHVVSCLSFKPNNPNILVTGSWDETLKIWDVSTIRPSCLSTVNAHSHYVSAVTWSSDGTMLVSGSIDGTMLVSSSIDQTITVFDAQTVEVKRSQSRHSAHVLGVCLSPDGSKIASSSRDQSIKIWNANTGECESTVSVDSGFWGVQSISYSPTGDMIAAGCRNGKIHLLDASTAEVKRSLSVDSGYGGVLSISYSPTRDMIAAGCDNGKIHLLDASTAQVKRSLRGDKQINCVAFSPDGKILAVGDGGKFKADNVRLCDPETGEVKSTLSVDSGHSGVQSLSYSPKGDMIAVGCYNGKIYLLDASTAEVMQSLSVDSVILSVAFSPDGSKIAAGSGDGNVRVFHSRSGDCESTLAGHSGGLQKVEFMHEGATLVSCGPDGTRFWDVQSGAAKSSYALPGGKFTFLRFHVSREQQVGQFLVTARDNVVRIFKALVGADKTDETDKEVNDKEDMAAPIAFFLAPALINTIDCAGDIIAVGCENGELLQLRAAVLLTA